ncbi:hypothetical protein D3C78_1641600 [compost metagenome]
MQPFDGTLHGQHGGMQNVQLIDFLDLGAGNTPAQGFFTDFVVELLATRFGEFLRVIEPQNRPVRIQDHRRRHHRATQRATANLVHASDQVLGVCDQGKVQPHLHLHITHCGLPISVSTAVAAWLEASRRKVRWI